MGISINKYGNSNPLPPDCMKPSEPAYLDVEAYARRGDVDESTVGVTLIEHPDGKGVNVLVTKNTPYGEDVVFEDNFRFND